MSQSLELEHELLNLLMQHPSQQHISHLAKRIAGDADLTALMILVGRSNAGRAENHASWVMRKLFDAEPLMLASFHDELCNWVLETDSDSVRRNLLPLLSAFLRQEFAAHAELVGKLYVKCFDWADSERYAIAVRCNAMQYLAEMAAIEPELKHELLPLFDKIHQHAKGGVWVRSRQLINQMRKSDQPHRRKNQTG
jgi:hypothetical protein